MWHGCDRGCHPGVSHLPVVITVQVTTDGQHGTSQAEALGCCSSKRVRRLVDQAGIEVEGWGVGARVDRRCLEAEEWEPSHRVKTDWDHGSAGRDGARVRSGNHRTGRSLGTVGVRACACRVPLTISPFPPITSLPSSEAFPSCRLARNNRQVLGVCSGGTECTNEGPSSDS